MSGGHFSYLDGQLKHEIFGWSDGFSNRFEDLEISELVWDVLNLIHDYDWYASSDTCEETWLKAKHKFKRKWFENRGMRIQCIVDTAIDELKDELYKTFDLKPTPRIIPRDYDDEDEELNL